MERTPPVNQKTIGYSEEGRPLNVIFAGQNESKLRIFIIAGQHGDEANGREAVLKLGTTDESFPETPSAQLAILLDANPDGSYRATRKNSKQIDLNRDHQRLEAKETRAIHDFARSWNPHLIIDVHNYPPRRKHLIAENRVIDYDVFLDTPTNPAVDLFSDQEALSDALLTTVQSDLSPHGYSCERYLLLKPQGKARRSTLDISDARNSLALRFGVLTVLLEGREPTEDDDFRAVKKLVSAQHQALLSIIRWAVNHETILTSGPKTVEDEIPIRYKYYPSNKNFEMKYRNALTGKSEIVPLQYYFADVKITESVRLPRSYAVPQDQVKVLEILDRHEFDSELSNGPRVEDVESYSLISAETLGGTKDKPTSNLTLKKESKSLEGYRIFRTDQVGGRTLALLLEPRSRYGLRRHADLRIPLSRRNPDYPILRIV